MVRPAFPWELSNCRSTLSVQFDVNFQINKKKMIKQLKATWCRIKSHERNHRTKRRTRSHNTTWINYTIEFGFELKPAGNRTQKFFIYEIKSNQIQVQLKCTRAQAHAFPNSSVVSRPMAENTHHSSSSENDLCFESEISRIVDSYSRPCRRIDLCVSLNRCAKRKNIVD